MRVVLLSIIPRFLSPAVLLQKKSERNNFISVLSSAYVFWEYNGRIDFPLLVDTVHRCLHFHVPIPGLAEECGQTFILPGRELSILGRVIRRKT